MTRISVGQLGERARVETKDGSIYTADLVIGADGVRSGVRSELWRHADIEKPGYIPKQDKTGMQTETLRIGLEDSLTTSCRHCVPVHSCDWHIS